MLPGGPAFVAWSPCYLRDYVHATWPVSSKWHHCPNTVYVPGGLRRFGKQQHPVHCQIDLFSLSGSILMMDVFLFPWP